MTRPATLPRLAAVPVALLALRYLGAVRRARGVSFISLVSIAGLVLGVAALVTVLSVMNGFDRELRSRILGIVPHVTLQPPPERLAETLAAVRARPGVHGAARYLETRGMLTTGSRVLPVVVAGIEPDVEADLSGLPGAMVRGDLAALTADGGVVLGAPLAARVGLFPGDPVRLLLPRAAGASVRPSILDARVVGLFRLGAEPDHGVAFVHVDRLAALDGLGETGVRLAVEEVQRAPAIAARLAEQLGLPAERVGDWSDRYGELFEAVGMEKTMMGLLLGLIVAVAVFNIVASLAMLVDEKRGAIAILRTLGASRGRVVRIFVLQGVLVGGIGVALGLVLGVLLALNVGGLMAFLEEAFGFRLLAGTYFERLPSQLQGPDLLWVGTGAFLLAVAGALYPALRAGTVEPAPALHGL